MKIIQLLPNISYGDAVSNDTLGIHNILREAGFETAIYAQTIGNRIPAEIVHPFEEMCELSKEDIVIYHGAIGTVLNTILPKYPCKKVMVYHNITPPDFFRDYSVDYVNVTADGYKGMKHLADKLDYCIADSGYNKEQLQKMRYKCPIEVCPIIIPLEDFRKEPDAGVLERYRNDRTTNILFVGRIAPNKAQEDIIRAFYVYHKHYNPDSRLFLVGSCGIDKYGNRLDKYVRALGMEEEVIFTGHIKFSEILAYYRLADAFVCMSEHEGFCVPVVEAMTFRIPIVAYKSSAVPETLGKGGLLLNSKDPYAAAVAINRIIEDTELRKQIIDNQEIEMKRFEYETVKEQFIGVLQNIFALRK